VSGPILVLPASSARRIRTATARWGRLAIAHDRTADVVGVVGSAELNGPMIKDSRSELAGHLLANVDADSMALWCRAQADLHAAHEWLARTGHRISTDFFLSILNLVGIVRETPADLVVTHTQRSQPEWAAWWLTGQGVAPLGIDILPPATANPLTVLEKAWPLADLTREVIVAGVGSIGSAVAHALAMYGVGRLTLVDDDRLQWHNLVRHQSTRRHIGRYKVDAIADEIRSRWPAAEVEALRLNLITDADVVRALFRRCSLVVCATDGVAPRRVANHLARTAKKTLVMACVLEDGALGEVLRLRPWPGLACLLCVRTALARIGAMNPEPALDSAYGTGTSHRSMTAVGSDLALVGQVAAKVSVATLLEDAGHHDQRLPGNWALVGLRGDVPLVPPFNVPPGEIHWPRMPHPVAGCPTCGAA